MSNILITGASGFIGSFMVEEALDRGMNVWAAVRRSSSKRYLTDKRINFIELDFGNKALLKQQLSGLHFDYVIHAAGVTKCTHTEDFYNMNTSGTVNLIEAIRETGMNISRFVFISSLSVFGPVREQQPYQDIKDTDPKRPDTHYGMSKDMAEEFVFAQRDIPSITLRLTGVYGPREKDYFQMVKSIKSHMDFAVGYRPQSLTFVYVKDVIQTAFLALDHGTLGKAYFVSDGVNYSSRTFSDLICQELGIHSVLRIKAPIWLLHLLSAGGQCIGKLTGRMPVLNLDKYKIMKQRNWQCDIEPTRRELGYQPQVLLAEGVHLSVEWYRKNHWI